MDKQPSKNELTKAPRESVMRLSKRNYEMRNDPEHLMKLTALVRACLSQAYTPDADDQTRMIVLNQWVSGLKQFGLDEVLKGFSAFATKHDGRRPYLSGVKAQINVERTRLAKIERYSSMRPKVQYDPDPKRPKLTDREMSDRRTGADKILAEAGFKLSNRRGKN